METERPKPRLTTTTVHDGRTAPARIRRMKHSRNPTRRLAGYALEGFARRPRTEGAFYIHLHAMYDHQRRAVNDCVGACLRSLTRSTIRPVTSTAAIVIVPKAGSTSIEQ